MPSDARMALKQVVHAMDGDEGLLRSTLPSPDDTQTQVWALYDELCRKASKVAELKFQPMNFLCVSEEALERLGDDMQTLKRLRMKLQSVDALPIHPAVYARMQRMKNLRAQHQRNPEDHGSPQYLWSWTVYFIRHIGRPALAQKVWDRFKDAHLDLKKKSAAAER